MATAIDVVIRIIGDPSPIVVTEPVTDAGGAVFGAPKQPKIGCFIFWNRPTNARSELSKLAERHGLKVQWETSLPPSQRQQPSLF